MDAALVIGPLCHALMSVIRVIRVIRLIRVIWLIRVVWFIRVF